MVIPNTEMLRADLVALITSANASALAGKIAHGPFYLFNPADAGGGAYFDLAAPYIPTDRGGWAAGTYNAGDRVTCDGYLFISVLNGNAARPLDAVTGNPSSNWRQPWYSCYQRIRDEVQTGSNAEVASALFPLTPWNLSVSGPWPCQAPDINYDKLAFYFEDTGSAESVTVSAGIGAPTHAGPGPGKQSFEETELLVDIIGNHGWGYALPTTHTTVGTVTSDTARTGPPGQFRFRYISDNEYALVVGGANPVPINITCTVGVGFLAGVTTREEATMAGGLNFPPDVYDTADPTGMISVDTSHWFPGAVFTAGAFSGWAIQGGGAASEGSVVFSCTINATVNPGTYSVKFTSSGTPNNRASGTLSSDSSTGLYSGFIQWQCDTFAWFDASISVAGTMAIVNSPGVTVPGIDDTHAVKKILVSDFSGIGPPIMMSVLNTMVPDISQDYAFVTSSKNIVEIIESAPANTSPADHQKLISITGGITFTATVPGYWAAVTPPVTSLGMLPFDKMPWNTFPNNLPSSGANTATKNQYLGYIQPFQGGKVFTNTDSQRAYNSAADAPAWMTTGTDADELLPWPKRWRAVTHYPVGFSIIDSYGNIQTLITQDGRSGMLEPVWPQNVGDITTEPNYVDLTSTPQPGAQWKLTHVLRDPPTVERNTAYVLDNSVVDDNGNVQQCSLAGVSGGASPAWGTTIGVITADGTAEWKLSRVNPKIAPAVARISPPIYPFFWHNPVSQWRPATAYAAGETITDSHGDIQSASGGISGAIEPAWSLTTSDGTIAWRRIKLNQASLTDPNVNPSTGKHDFDFKPQGWFLYRVFLNRIPQKKSTDKPDAPPINVQLGCVRGGVFVSFGTFPTGTPVDAIWPIFTNTALAYEAPERIDVQAEILTCGLGYATWGNVHFPMAAAHLNDIASIIGLL